jgi:hypothetical protein
MIETLTTSLALYRVHRDKEAMLDAEDRRKAFWLLSVLVACMSVVAYVVIFYIL